VGGERGECSRDRRENYYVKVRGSVVRRNVLCSLETGDWRLETHAINHRHKP